MSRSATSLFVFSIYLLILGSVLVIVPNFLIELVGFPHTSEPWIRTTGMLILLITPYYFYAVKNNIVGFIEVTVYTRAAVMVVFIIFVALEWSQKQLILFSIPDMAGAIWTYLALRSEGLVNDNRAIV